MRRHAIHPVTCSIAACNNPDKQSLGVQLTNTCHNMARQLLGRPPHE
jgi:hypothetical protein